ncbi:MAG: hypothetical protein ACREMY_06490, partial [bacterium]
MRATRVLVWVHRWAGIVLCLFFSLWFVSGAILIYVPFPSLSQAARLRGAETVDVSRIVVSPGEAVRASAVGALDRLRVVNVDGRVIYVLQPLGAPVRAVDAHSGIAIEAFDVATASRVAAGFAKLRVKRIEGPIDFDQWMVADEFDALRPFYRAEIADTIGTELYVSARSGEVVQWTHRHERAWNYLGAVVHWIYPTVLRRHWVVWDQVVWWLSLAGIIVASIGIWLGITRVPGRQRSGRWKLTPFRGWLRWHHILGLSAGAIVFTWILSGWLSMDHGRLFSLPDPAEGRTARFRGVPLSEVAQSIRAEQLRQIGPFHEAELNVISSVPLWVTRDPEHQL